MKAESAHQAGLVAHLVGEGYALQVAGSMAHQVTKFDAETRVVRASGIDFHVLEMGAGPLVLCLHGFPDTAHSFRHQMPMLADAGFHVVAPFMRPPGMLLLNAQTPQRLTLLNVSVCIPVTLHHCHGVQKCRKPIG